MAKRRPLTSDNEPIPPAKEVMKHDYKNHNYCFPCNLEYPKFTLKCAACTRPLRTKSHWEKEDDFLTWI